jgi:ligand-binding sensor domain-containing protein
MLLPHLHGQRNSYQLFENIGLGPEASVTNCFLQDRQGIIWIGSNKGLFSYDGYSVQAHLGAGKANNAWIYCGVIIDQTYLYLGTDNGMLIYNYKTDQYETPAISFPKDFRSMALQGDHLWIGTLNGLFVYHIRNHTLKQFDTKRYKGLTHSAVYSIIHTTDNHIYVGTYNGLSRYIVAEDRFEPVNLPAAPGKKNLFINSLLEDVSRQCIWIGTEGSLFKYSPSNGQAEQIESVLKMFFCRFNRLYRAMRIIRYIRKERS